MRDFVILVGHPEGPERMQIPWSTVVGREWRMTIVEPVDMKTFLADIGPDTPVPIKHRVFRMYPIASEADRTLPRSQRWWLGVYSRTE